MLIIAVIVLQPSTRSVHHRASSSATMGQAGRVAEPIRTTIDVYKRRSANRRLSAAADIPRAPPPDVLSGTLNFKDSDTHDTHTTARPGIPWQSGLAFCIPALAGGSDHRSHHRSILSDSNVYGNDHGRSARSTDSISLAKTERWFSPTMSGFPTTTGGTAIQTVQVTRYRTGR